MKEAEEKHIDSIAEGKYTDLIKAVKSFGKYVESEVKADDENKACIVLADDIDHTACMYAGDNTLLSATISSLMEHDDNVREIIEGAVIGYEIYQATIKNK